MLTQRLEEVVLEEVALRVLAGHAPPVVGENVEDGEDEDEDSSTLA